jgi:HEAT repeat protein
MLENLDSIAWSQLTHAYGAATDVPAQIRNLASANEGERGNALWELYGNIFHEGARYPATPYAVPFLYELVTAPETPDRHEIVYLLVSLALGCEESYLPDGLDVANFCGALKESDSQMSLTDQAECDEYGVGPRADLDCYDSVQNGVPVLIKLMTDDDARLRRAAIYALAWFPENARQSLPAIRQFLANASDEIEVANALVAYGVLARSSKSAINESELRDFLSHASLIIRVAAAIAIARDPLTDDIIEILVASILAAEDLQIRGEDIRFNEGNLAGYACRVLARWGSRTRDKIVPALCETLKSVNKHQSLDVTRSLLDLIVGDRTTPIKDMPAGALDPLELSALREIARHGRWIVGNYVFVNYSDLVREHGLPDSQESLIEYLSQ